MPAFLLRHGLFYCTVRDRTIFLDVTENRYFGLSSELDSMFRHIAAGEMPPAADAVAAERLVELAILIRADGDHQALQPANVPAPATSLIDTISSCPSPLQAFGYLAQEFVEIMRLRWHPFEETIGTLRFRASARSVTPGQLDIARHVVAAARRVRSLRTAHDRCLPRSIAMFRLMGSRGFWPSLVIGIGDSAFTAHCWLQQGDVVLNDEVDVVRCYTPILVI
jgi:hypothetical protein